MKPTPKIRAIIAGIIGVTLLFGLGRMMHYFFPMDTNLEGLIIGVVIAKNIMGCVSHYKKEKEMVSKGAVLGKDGEYHFKEE